MKTTAERYIDATEEATAKLAKAFKVTPKYVYLCLTYRCNSGIAQRIRYTAVQVYGATPMHHCPECKTMFQTSEGGRDLMVQYFDNGVRLEANRRTGVVLLYDRKGKEVGRWHDVLLSKLSEIQLYAETL